MDFSGSSNQQPTFAGLNRLWNCGWFRLGITFSALIAFAVYLYLSENHSGKGAWLKHKRMLEAKGESLDWKNYIPAEIPPDQNIFAAPEMQDSFVKGGSARLMRTLNPGSSITQRPLWRARPVADITIALPNQTILAQESDLTLYYDAPHLRLAGTNDEAGSIERVIPLIVMQEVPLPDAIRNLANEGKIKYMVDAGTLPADRNNPLAYPSVSLRWENLTARHALKQVLKNYELALVEDPAGSPARIIRQDSAKPKVFVDEQTRKKINALTAQVLSPITEARKQVTLNGSQGYTLFKTPLTPFKPIHILVRAEAIPDREELAAFFSGAIAAGARQDTGPVQVQSAGTNTFHAIISPRVFDAAEYLEWSDQFEGAFDLLRDGLKRPYARMDGNYEIPFAMPMPNFVSLRILAQTLGQRAQCSLLLDQPEEALRDLTLLHDLRKLLEPMHRTNAVTLVAAMVNVAIAAVYEEVIADGFRLRAWKEPELQTLQKQLAEVDLMPSVLQGLRTERASMCRTLENTPSTEMHLLFTGLRRPTLSQRVCDPQFWLLTAAPRGWVYDNMVTLSAYHQTFLDFYDPKRGTIRPRDFDDAGRAFDRKLHHWSPSTFIAARGVPNFTRAWQSAALYQDKARQALLACALERYRIARGSYAETLASLIPDFVPRLPVDVINGNNFLYSLKGKDRFLLYSMGWNEKDDGGQQGQEGRLAEGDWVWGAEQKSGS